MDAPTQPGSLAALRAALDIVAVAEKLGLEPVRTSAGGAKILCPSHAEDSPSCLLYADGHLHCFGCGFHGSALDLISTVRGTDFGSAVEWAADTFGLPRPVRDPAAAARSAALRSVRDHLRTALLTAPDIIPAGLTPEAAEAIGLGFADAAFEELVASLAPGSAPLTVSEARAWLGRPTLELSARSGVVGVASIFESDAGAILMRPKRLLFPALAGFSTAHAAASEIGAIYHAADPLLFLAARAAGVRAVVSAGRPADRAIATLMAGLAPRVVLLRRPGAGLPLEEAMAILSSGARVGFAAAGADGVPTAAARLSEALSRALSGIAQRARAATVKDLLDAVPSRSSRELYIAEFIKRGLLS